MTVVRREIKMKSEDFALVIAVGFIIVFTVLFGMYA